MKRHSILLVALFLYAISYGQTLDWVKGLGTSKAVEEDRESPDFIDIDEQGILSCVMLIVDTIQIDQTVIPFEPDSFNAFVPHTGILRFKLDTTGQLIAWNVWDSDAGLQVFDYQVRPDGSWFLHGIAYTSGGVIDTFSILRNRRFIMEFDSLNQIQSIGYCQFNTFSNPTIYVDPKRTVRTDQSGNSYYLNRFSNSLNPIYIHLILGDTISSQTGGLDDLALHKFDHLGHRLWTQIIGMRASDEPGTIEIDYQDNVYISMQIVDNPNQIDTLFVGDTLIVPDINHSTGPNVGNTYWLWLKLNPEGKLLDHKLFSAFRNFPGSNAVIQIFTPQFDPSDNQYAWFAYRDGPISMNTLSIDDHILPSQYNRSAGHFRLDTNDTIGWLHHVMGENGTGNTLPLYPGFQRMLVDSIGNIFYIGRRVTVSFDLLDAPTIPESPSGISPELDLIVYKYNPEGRFLWHVDIGSKEKEHFADAVVADREYLYLSGFFRGSTNFGTTVLNSEGPTDGFIARYYTCAPTITARGRDLICVGDTVWLDANSCKGRSYSWLRNGQVIPNATHYSYPATLGGDYQAIISYNGQADTTPVHTLGAISQPDSLIVDVFPTVGCGGFTRLTVQNPGADNCRNFIWSNGDQLCSANTFVSDTLDVFVIDSNGCRRSSPRIPVIVDTQTIRPPVIILVGDSLCSDTTSDNFDYIWVLNDTLPIGINASCIAPTDTGTYTLIIRTYNPEDPTIGCITDYSEGLLYTSSMGPSSLNQSSIPAFELYPNPSDGDFILHWQNAPQSLMTNLQLMNLQGKNIWESQQISQETMHITFKGKISAGTYLLLIQNEKGLWSKRIQIK